MRLIDIPTLSYLQYWWGIRRRYFILFSAVNPITICSSASRRGPRLSSILFIQTLEPPLPRCPPPLHRPRSIASRPVPSQCPPLQHSSFEGSADCPSWPNLLSRLDHHHHHHHQHHRCHQRTSTTSSPSSQSCARNPVLSSSAAPYQKRVLMHGGLCQRGTGKQNRRSAVR
jgi:hypothetical protein